MHELGITRASLPPITLIHPNNEVRKKIALAIVQQWKEVLGVSIQLQSCSFKDLFKKMTAGEYQLGAINWLAKIDDPIYTLNAFKNCEDKINFSKWENKLYNQLIEKSNQEINLKRRNYNLAKAEAILITEVPIIPLFHEKEFFMKQNYINGISRNIRTPDFKYAFVNRKSKQFEPRKFYE